MQHWFCIFSDSYKVSGMETSSDHTMLILGFKFEDNKIFAVFSNKAWITPRCKRKINNGFAVKSCSVSTISPSSLFRDPVAFIYTCGKIWYCWSLFFKAIDNDKVCDPNSSVWKRRKFFPFRKFADEPKCKCLCVFAKCGSRVKPCVCCVQSSDVQTSDPRFSNACGEPLVPPPCNPKAWAQSSNLTCCSPDRLPSSSQPLMCRLRYLTCHKGRTSMF